LLPRMAWTCRVTPAEFLTVIVIRAPGGCEWIATISEWLGHPE